MATDSIRVASRSPLQLLVILTAFVVGISARPSIQADEPFVRYDLEMMVRPLLPKGDFVRAFPEGLLPLWMQALDRPDAELQRMTIDTLAIAHQRGLQGTDTTKSRLMQLLEEPDQDLDVMIAIARTLIQFDAKDATPQLIKAVQKRGDPIALIVEPALAKWKSPIFNDQWLARLEQSNTTETMKLLAIKGLEATNETQADSPLFNIVTDATASVTVRLAAAKAIGVIGTPDACDRARKLIDASLKTETANVTKSNPVPPLLTVALLQSDDSQESVDLLIQLAGHPNSLVQAASLDRLFQIDPKHVDALANELVTSRDVNVRRLCVRAMLHQPRKARVAQIAPLLNDVNPSLRRQVTAGLLDWAQTKELKSEVIQQAMRVMQNNSWQGCEQAIVVLVKLNHKPAGSRMVDLLGHPRGEVKVASAWGLTKLRDEQYLPAMLEQAERIHAGFANGTLNENMPGVSLQIAHLFIGFGDQMYAPAETVLRAYLPKNIEWGTESRAAACWAIGLLLADEAPKDLVKILTERIYDVNSLIPEEDLFRSMCAIAFARMNLTDKIKDLRLLGAGSVRFSQACYWAIQQMTGEEPPPVPTRTLMQEDWFLLPALAQ